MSYGYNNILAICCGNKFILFLLAFFICGINSENQAQGFKKGSHYLNSGLGFGVYNVTTQIGDKVSEKDAGSFIIPLNYEYGLLNQVGLGGQYQWGRYSSSDSAIQSNISSHTFLFSNTLHFLNDDLIDLYFGISYGFGTYKYRAANSTGNETLIKGGGFAYLVSSGVKIHITQGTGVFLGVNYNNSSYQINTYRIDDKNEINYSRKNYNINFTGINILCGISIVLSE
ncbi:MAG: hypothetical protein H0V01_15460 [Bacteroidetes bacterium]|nr:hypothetical protein [Bacteroidota bacterium]HET6243945.1 outer membrane beta-barrel protein [Bacteroidia bacterium]